MIPVAELYNTLLPPIQKIFGVLGQLEDRV